MNVASKELCVELYELSGWKDTLIKHVVGERHASQFDSGFGVTTVYDKTVGVYGNTVGCDECEGEYAADTIPAYDLGYLLRKLPPVVTLKSRAGRKWVAQCYRGKMTDDGNGIEKIDMSFTAVTPEDAACKLAIELFKQGVLPSPNQALKTEEKI